MSMRDVLFAAFGIIAMVEAPSCDFILGMNGGSRLGSDSPMSVEMDSEATEAGQGGSGAQGGSGGQGSECSSTRDCPAPSSPCSVVTCTAGACEEQIAPDGTPSYEQEPGDCMVVLCEGGVGSLEVPDPGDPASDGNECTDDICNGTSTEHPPSPAEGPCGPGRSHFCDGAGLCVECTGEPLCGGWGTYCLGCEFGEICNNGVCVASTCDDGAVGGFEPDVDCGGPCPPCQGAATCFVGEDCESQVCEHWNCMGPDCQDGIRNGLETDVDCGAGPGCPPCWPGQLCNVASDCEELVCSGGVCQLPTCDDGVKNNDESDVDCGAWCFGCEAGAMCKSAWDCISGVCEAGVCQAPTCADGVWNGEETGVDCGGPTCVPCMDG